MLATLSGSFGTLALLLSLVGLYGVMSFVVTQRTREIGIRLALGATRSATVWLVLRDALVMIAAGIAIALPCVWALGRLVESQLYDVKPTDPVAIAVATPGSGLGGAGRSAHSCPPRLGGEPNGRATIRVARPSVCTVRRRNLRLRSAAVRIPGSEFHRGNNGEHCNDNAEALGHT